MTPGTYNLVIYRGDTYDWRFQLWQDPEQTIPVDLTGVIIEAQIRNKAGGTLATTLDCVLEPPNIINVSLDAEASMLVPPSGAWDLQLTFPDGAVRTPVAGLVKATLDVTTPVTTRSARLRSA